MENMVIKNINIIDWNLKQNFENVKIVEKSKKSDFYFEISLNSKVEGVNIPLILEISKIELLNNKINWRYLTNANNEEKISKISDIKSLSEDIKDIFLNKRFDKDYLNKFIENKNIENIDSQLIKESIQELENDLIENVKNKIILLDENIIKNIQSEILLSESITDKRKTKITINLSRELKYFEMFDLESNLSNIENLTISSDKIRFII